MRQGAQGIGSEAGVRGWSQEVEIGTPRSKSWGEG